MSSFCNVYIIHLNFHELISSIIMLTHLKLSLVFLVFVVRCFLVVVSLQETSAAHAQNKVRPGSPSTAN